MAKRSGMNKDDETKYALRERIKRLEEDNQILRNKSDCYKTTVLEIFDMIASLENGKYFDPNVYLKKLRRCFQ